MYALTITMLCFSDLHQMLTMTSCTNHKYFGSENLIDIVLRKFYVGYLQSKQTACEYLTMTDSVPCFADRDPDFVSL